MIFFLNSLSSFRLFIFFSLFVFGLSHEIQDRQKPSFSGVELNVRLEEKTGEVRDHRDTELRKRQACGAGIGSCPAGQCCSSGGQCGTGHAYCNGPNCQLAYGPLGKCFSSWSQYSQYTFDDGPYNFTTMVLSTLAKYNVTATFFINGNSLGKGRIDDPNTPWPQTLQSMHATGHQLASHTWTHQDLTSLPQNLMANQVLYNEIAFRNIFGFFPTYIRPPYGYCSGSSNCSTYLNNMGYHIIIWDVDTKDYMNDDPTMIFNSEKNFAGNTSNPANGHSYISLSHDVHLNTALTLVANMLDTLLARGYKAVTVGECLGDPRSNWYRDGVTGGVVASSSTASSLTKTSSSVSTVKTGTTSSNIQALSAVAVATASSHSTTSPGTSSAMSSPTSAPTSMATAVPKLSAAHLLEFSLFNCIFVLWSS